MTLPAHSFTDIALDLFAVATQGARQVGAMEGQAMAMARAGENESAEDRERMWSIFETGLIDARRLAQTTAHAHEILKTLADYESEIRALIARKT